MNVRFYAFWAINAPLDQARLRRQLEEFRACGFDGLVWHPRFYPGKPPYLGDKYLAEVSEVVLHAKSLGLAFWIYDEDGWPSGTVGGQLLKQYPDDAQRWADLVLEKPERCLAEFECNGQKWFLAERIGHGVDYFNPALARHFIELTHERYRTGLKPEAWEYVEAMFCDEPEFGLGHAYDSLSPHGAIPWTPKLPELFRARHGGDLLANIAGLFFAGPSAAATRVQFWELLTDLFNDSFTTPINGWCRRQGKLFTVHVKGEEHPLFQVPTNGSCHQFYRRLDLPAADALERHPGNNFYPRQLSSAARQFGSGRCLVEAFGGAGWGATPVDLERYLLWLGRHGLTDFVLHLSQYRLDSAALRDWPPSQPLHLTWRSVYPEVLRRVRHALAAGPRPAADTLVIAPGRGIMANYQPWEFLQTNVHNATTYPDTAAGKINRRFLEQVEALHRAGVNFDVADERTVEQFGRVAVGKLAVGNCEYPNVIVPEGCELNEGVRQLVETLADGATASGTARRVGVQASACPGGTPKRELQRAVPEAGAPIPELQRAGAVPGAPVPVQWRLETHPLNSLLLEPVPNADGSFTAQFETSGALDALPLRLFFADDIASLSVNGQTLPLEPAGEGSVARLSGSVMAGVNAAFFRPVKIVERPFVWLKGCFRVRSSLPFLAGPNRTLKTDGAFSLEPPRKTVGRDLVADGFPFLQTGLMVSAEIELSHAVSTLQLNSVEADAVRLFVDEQDFGWGWGEDGDVRFPAELPAGKHLVKIELLPNSFNGFGPHHYYAGDWHVVSPDQMKGVRHFADAPGAPANTHVAAWHFRRFTLPAGISLTWDLPSRAGCG